MYWFRDITMQKIGARQWSGSSGASDLRESVETQYEFQRPINVPFAAGVTASRIRFQEQSRPPANGPQNLEATAEAGAEP